MHPKIFVTQPIPEKALARLREIGTVELNPDPLHIITKAELIAALKQSDYLFCLLHDTVDAEIITANPHLKLIASMAIIPASIDVAAATARRIPVTTIPPVVGEATADLNWALLLAVARRVVEADRAIRSGLFSRRPVDALRGNRSARQDFGHRRARGHRRSGGAAR
ncbi:MAG TPA: hypothetical protein VGL11_08985 [Candidatus Binatia bacterium]